METPATLTSIKVHFPEMKGKRMIGYMKYKITFCYNGTET